MHEETAIDAMAEASVKKAKKKYAKKRQRFKMAAEMSKITKNVNDAKEEKKITKKKKQEAATNRRVDTLYKERIEEVEKKIREAAENGDSYIRMSALWSDTVEIRIQSKIQEWARKQGFRIDTSYSEIYESPRGSDDLPCDTRGFLTIEWE